MRGQGPQMTRHTPRSLAIRSEEAWGHLGTGGERWDSPVRASSGRSGLDGSSGENRIPGGGNTSRAGSQSTVRERSLKKRHLQCQYEKLVILDPHWEVTPKVSESA